MPFEALGLNYYEFAVRTRSIPELETFIADKVKLYSELLQSSSVDHSTELDEWLMDVEDKRSKLKEVWRFYRVVAWKTTTKGDDDDDTMTVLYESGLSVLDLVLEELRDKMLI